MSVLSDIFRHGLSHHAILIEGGYAAVRDELLGNLANSLGISSLANPDFVEFTYDQFGVDSARELRDRLGRAPFGDAYYVILGIGAATVEAQNALLKLIEDPPAPTHLFLISRSSGTFIPTFLSRFQIVSEKSTPVAVSDFLRLSPLERSEKLSRFSGKHTPAQKKEMRAELLSLLEGLENELCQKSEDVLAHPSVCHALLDARKNIDLPAASFKLILEHLVFVLPEKK